MKKIITTYVCAAMMAAVSPMAMGQKAAVNNAVKVVCNDAVQRGDSLYLDAVITVNNASIKSRKSLELTPMVVSGDQKDGFLSVLLNGRIRNKVYDREIKLKNVEPVPHYRVEKVNKKQPERVIHYQSAVGWEDWMKNGRIYLNADLCGCGQQEDSQLLIADKIRRRPDQRYEMVPTFVYISPMAETEKHRAEVGQAYLDFQVGKSQILTDFRNNAAELAKINQTIASVTSDKNITLKGILLKGYASPEGSFASNERLSGDRVKALAEYIRSKHNFPRDYFTNEAGGEDWVGFKAAVEADQSVPMREEVLAIINSSDQPDQKEAKLRALKGGAYNYVLKEIFPSLRRSDYKVDYTVRFFTVEEGREIIKIRPQQLSLSEMFAIANSYEVGSEDYNNVFDIAVRMYSDNPVANLNAANIAMTKGDYASAEKYLAKSGNSPEAINARGVLAMLNGNLEEASRLLNQAQAAGVKEAAVNLQEIQKKLDDNAVFDSFK